MSEVLEKNRTAQQDCIEEHEGNWLVIAGPGTGKTYTITERIKKMTADGIKPETILCLTFSDTAAKEMKNRVGDKNNIDVFTFHSFCKKIMDDYSEEFGTEPPKVISDSYKRTLISECISEREPVKYNNEKGNPYRFVEDILNGIEEIKKSRIREKSTLDKCIDQNPMWRPRLAQLEEKAKEELERAELKKKESIEKKEETIAKLTLKPILTPKQQDDLEKAKRLLKKEQEKPLKLKVPKMIDNLNLKIEKMDELWDFYEMYSSKMSELHYIDFNDMINKVLEKFEDDENNLLETVAQKYQYIIVDEYQDTNTAQNDIVFNLAKICPNVFVVGDDDQIIYTFQGAHLDTLEKFNKELSPHVRCFDKNYRSTQPILDVAMNLAKLQDTSFNEFMAGKETELKEHYSKISEVPSDLRFKINDDDGNIISKKLISAKEELKPFTKPVDLYRFDKSDNERAWIVQEIASIKKEFDDFNEKEIEAAKNENRSPKIKKLSEIALLTRQNKELKDFADYLKANGVPVEITGGKNIFEITPVNLLISYMQALVNPEKYKDKLLSFMLSKPFHIHPIDFEGIWNVRTHYNNLVDNIEEYLNQNSERVVEKKALWNFVETYKYLQEYIYSENYKTAILEIGKKTDIFDYYFNKNEINKLENIKGIKKLIETTEVYFEVNKNSGNSFTLFVEYLSNLMDSGSEIKLDKEEEPLNAVQLSTYHSSKGREFEYVFMPSLTSDRLDTIKTDKDTIPTKPKMTDSYESVLNKKYQAFFLDRIKLLYVGMTRAKHTLVLSYTGEPKDDDKFNGLSWFIKQLANNPKNIDGETILEEHEVDSEKIECKIPEYDYDYKEEFKDYIELNIPNEFAITPINTYRDCPKKYFCEKILKLKAHTGSRDDLSYGSALHSVFEQAIKKVMTKDEKGDRAYLSDEEALKVFVNKLKTLEITNPDGAKRSAAINIFSEKGFYQDFKSLVKPEDIEQNSEFEKHPVLDNKPEGKYKIYAEVPLKYDITNELDADTKDKKIYLTGSVDRLDKNPDGTYTVYDYKTKENCDDISPGEDYFYQMVFYKYVLEKQYPGIDITKACFILPIEKNGNHYINIYSKMFDKKRGKEYDCTNYEFTVDEIKKAIVNILDGQFDTSENPNCSYCGYKYLCKDRKVI